MTRTLVLLAALAGVARADVAADLAAIERDAPTCAADRAHCIGIALHVAGDASAVVTPDWVAAQLAGANRHFAPLELGFQLASVDALPAAALHVATRAERSALAVGRVRGRVIDVFVVGQLDDIDRERNTIRGVTWRTRDGRKFVILSADALERTLAHELGHVFGLPHSTYAISIMNKTERDDPPMEQRTFAPEELAAMRPVLRRVLRAGELVDLAKP